MRTRTVAGALEAVGEKLIPRRSWNHDFGSCAGTALHRAAPAGGRLKRSMIAAALSAACIVSAAEQPGMIAIKDASILTVSHGNIQKGSVLIRADEARDIRNAVEFGKKEKLELVLVGGREAKKVAVGNFGSQLAT